MSEFFVIPACATEIVNIKGQECALELGQWTIPKVDALLQDVQTGYQSFPDRSLAISQALLGTAFFAESSLPLPPKGILRVRLHTLDCVTFVYTVAALSISRTFEGFIQILKDLRFRDEGGSVDNDPETGNIYDFVSEAFLMNPKASFLKDITAECVGSENVQRFYANELPIRRSGRFDPEERLVTPKLAGGLVFSDFIPTEKLRSVNLSGISRGDLLLFTRSKDREEPMLIGHCAVADWNNGELTFIHASRHAAKHNRELEDGWPGTGAYYMDDRLIEQLGVSVSYHPTEQEVIAVGEQDTLYGYDPGKVRNIFDYSASCGFTGVKVLRLQPQHG